MFKLFLAKAEEPEIQLSTILDNWKSKKVPGKQTNKQTNKKTYFCFIDYAKALDCVDHYKL